jgi:hypothetical protein
MGGGDLGVLRKETVGKLGQYRTEKAGVGWQAGKNRQKLIRGRTGLPMENGPKSGSLQNRNFQILNRIL